MVLHFLSQAYIGRVSGLRGLQNGKAIPIIRYKAGGLVSEGVEMERMSVLIAMSSVTTRSRPILSIRATLLLESIVSELRQLQSWL